MDLQSKDNLLIDLPHRDLEIEKSVLGAIIYEDNEYTSEAKYNLNSNYFTKDLHILISDIVIELSNKHLSIDTLKVIHELRSRDIEFYPADVVELTHKINSASNVMHHLFYLKELYIKRSVIESCHKTIQAINGKQDIFEAKTNHELCLQEIDKESYEREITVKQSMQNYLEKFEKVQKGEIEPAVYTGLNFIDVMLRGLKPALTIIAARPGMGKSAGALQIAINVSIQNIPTSFFTLEMNEESVVKRIISNVSEVPYSKVSDYELDTTDLDQVIKSSSGIEKLNLKINDKADLTLREIKGNVIKNKSKLVIVDYIQLVKSQGYNRENEISKLSRGLKQLSLELNIPIIALSQLSRAVEQRTDKRPQLSDLRESGAIEQDADNVVFFYRPEYYGITEDADGNSTKDLVEVIIAKNRDGKTGSDFCVFKRDVMKFKNYEYDL